MGVNKTNFPRRLSTSSLHQDKQSFRLQKKLAPSASYRQDVDLGGKHRTVHVYRSIEPTRSTETPVGSYDHRSHRTRNEYPIATSRMAKSCKPNQDDSNRFAFQHADTTTLSLEKKISSFCRGENEPQIKSASMVAAQHCCTLHALSLIGATHCPTQGMILKGIWRLKLFVLIGLQMIVAASWR